MSLAIFAQAIKDKLPGAAIVAAIMFVLLFFIAAQYDSISGLESLNEMLKNPALKALVGNIASVTTFEGYLYSKGFVMMSLVIGGYLAFLTASFLAGEIESKTFDLLLSLPVARESLVLARFAAITPVVALILVAEYAAVYLGATLVGVDTSATWLGLAIACQGLFAMAAGAMTLLISAVMSDGRKAALVSLGVLLGMYFLETIGATVEGLGAIKYLSLYHYQGLSDVFVNHTLDAANIGAIVLLIVVFLGLAVLAFRRREINV